MLPLFLVLIIDTMALGLVFPILGPLFMSHVGGILPTTTSIGVRDFLYGLSLSVFSVMMFFGSPFLGDLSDRIGRKRVLLLSLFGGAVGLFLSALGVYYNSIGLFVFGRAFDGFTAGSNPIAQAAIADISTKENKAKNLSFMILANCIGFVIGPIFGGYFADKNLVSWFSYSTPFFAASILCIVNGILLLFIFKETFELEVEKKLQLLKGLTVFIQAFTTKRFRLLSTGMFLMQVGWCLYFMFISLYLVQLFHYGNVGIGQFMAYFGLIWAISLSVIIRVAEKYLSLKTMVVSSAVLLGGGIFMAVVHTEWVQWVCAIPVGIGSALGYSATLAIYSNAVDKEHQGWILGIAGAIVAGAWGVGSLITGPLGDLNIALPFIVAGISVFVGGYLVSLFKLHPQ